MGKSRRMMLLGIFGLAILLPVIGHGVRQNGESGCALDGQRIDPFFRVRITDPVHGSQEFCCIRCAEIWLAQRERRTREIFVTDEPSGQEIPASSAFFVRNLVATMKSTGNRIHAFKELATAEDNARTFLGSLLPDAERPFATQR